MTDIEQDELFQECLAEMDKRAMKYLLLSDEQAYRIEALEAENERLRARLAHAEDDCEDDCIYCEERRQEIARAALGEKQ